MLLNKLDTPLQACDLKFDDGRFGLFEGYASVFGRVDSFGDTVVKGAFEKTLEERERPPLMLFGHSPGRVIGKWLDLREDDIGLRVQGELTPDHTEAKNVFASMRHGAVNGLSIGFRDRDSEETENGGRLLREIDLVEISVVSMPAEDAARIDSVRSELMELNTIRDVELWLRDAAAFTRTDAKAFLSRLGEILQRDADGALLEEIKALRAQNGVAELRKILNQHGRIFA